MKKFYKIALPAVISAAILAAVLILFIAYCNYAVNRCSQYCTRDIDALSRSETALVPGAAKINPSGTPNSYFAGRIKTAAKLFYAGKVGHILVSGDNSRKDYDEPTDMKNALLEYGVPATAITLDYAGFRTLDSVLRAKNVFGKHKILVITQPLHAERTVYIARKHDIEATAFYALEPEHLRWVVVRNRMREKLACVAAWLDVNVLSRKPRFEK